MPQVPLRLVGPTIIYLVISVIRITLGIAVSPQRY